MNLNSIFKNIRFPRICIIGSGPAGMYACGELLTRLPSSAAAGCIHVLDRDPEPFGLVRFGVAPDHMDDKRIIDNTFKPWLQDSRVQFFPNVDVGTDVQLHELRAAYDAVVLATGAFVDRRLPDFDGSADVQVASDVVSWYNGRRRGRDRSSASWSPPASAANGSKLVVVGAGNVALDVCRVFLKQPDRLRETPIAPEALAFLQQTRVSEVHLIARRSRQHAAFTTRVLRDLLTELQFHVKLRENSQLESSSADLTRAQQRQGPLWDRVISSDNDASSSPPSTTGPRLHCWFGHQIDHVSSPSPHSLAVSLADGQTIDGVGLIVSCIGFQVSVKGLEWAPGKQLQLTDGNQGVLLTDGHGRVLVRDPAPIAVPGLYACGWLKRGPSGIIGTNGPDSKQTVSSMLQDFNLD